jgi:AcrR family transcriptional regulator
VTRGALYHHFADKRDLFRAVREQMEAELVEGIGRHLAEAAVSDPIEGLRVGVRSFLDACTDPSFARITLIDAPAVLGWARWREVGMKYGLGVIEAMLAAAMADGVIPDQPLRPTAHILLGALDEAALFVARADDRGRALEQMYVVCDRLISGIAGT